MKPTRRLALALLTCGAGGVVFGASAQTQASLAARLRTLLGVPDARLDYLQTKLAFDAIINPTLETTAASRVIDRMTAAARELAGPNADDARKLAAVRTVIYQPGAWNDNRPFAYDMRDPLGHDINNKLLATYVRTRLGNCVSMPILFLIIGDRLGLNLGLATAPHHVFVRYTAGDGRAVNLEATSGGHPARDIWYREHMPMTYAAIANGIYMRTLSRRESVAEMGMVVVESLAQDCFRGVFSGTARAGSRPRYEDLIDAASVILEFAPRNIAALLYQASAYGAMLHDEFEQHYPTPDLIPLGLRQRYVMLGEMNYQLFARAEALGWRPGE